MDRIIGITIGVCSVLVSIALVEQRRETARLQVELERHAQVRRTGMHEVRHRLELLEIQAACDGSLAKRIRGLLEGQGV